MHANLLGLPLASACSAAVTQSPYGEPLDALGCFDRYKHSIRGVGGQTRCPVPLAPDAP